MGSKGRRVAPSGLQEPRARPRGSRGQLPPQQERVLRAPGRKWSPLPPCVRSFPDSLPPLGSSAESAGHRNSSLSSRRALVRSLVLPQMSVKPVTAATETRKHAKLVQGQGQGPGPASQTTQHPEPQTEAEEEEDSPRLRGQQPGAPQNPFKDSQKMVRRNFAVITFKQFFNIMKQQHILQGRRGKCHPAGTSSLFPGWGITCPPEDSGRSSDDVAFSPSPKVPLFLSQ